MPVEPVVEKVRKEDPNDIILVKNIDIDCDEVTREINRVSRVIEDEETGARTTEYFDQPEEWSHRDYFMVKWGGQRFKIAPGETKRMPRFIAEHYAKHLADHILGKRELAERRVGLITSATERPKVLAEILVSVDTYFTELGEVDPAEQALSQVEELNAPVAAPFGYTESGKGVELREADGGVVPNKAVGKLTAEPESTEDILKRVVEEEPVKEAVTVPDTKTKADLIQEIRKMDPSAKLTGKESKDVLTNKLKGF